MSDEVLLSVSNLTKHFPVQSSSAFSRNKEVVRAVDGVSMELRQGQTLGLVGESGCGKSTLARCIMGLQPITSGRVIFEGRDLAQMSKSDRRRARREMQMVFQDPFGSLNPRRRVGSIISDPLEINTKLSKQDRRKRSQELMELVGLNPEHYNRFPVDFSGGQRQRIGVARSLALNPKLIICDEPVSALDVSIQAQVLNLLSDLQKEFNLAYLFISHNLTVVEHVSDHLAVMYLGSIVETGDAKEIYRSPRHPYTNALLSAAPVADLSSAGERKRIVLGGDPPSPTDPPPGCRFHPRCPKARLDARPNCSVDLPLLESRNEDTASHLTACHYPIEPEERWSALNAKTKGM
jgi:oligopeptide/dipeptide ABC transporter ATP-binding protein